MTWIQKLYHTYERIQNLDLSNDEPLTPIGHTVQNAHIVITINGQGQFRSASVLPPKTGIILPATEDSENRTVGEAAHALADKIQYIAKDYAEFGGNKKAYFDGYLAQLEKWCQSEYQNMKVKAVYDYVKQGRVVADLVQAGVLPVDENKKLIHKWQSQNDDNAKEEVPDIFKTLPKSADMDMGSALVCWRVEIEGDPHTDTWTDVAVQQSWTNYLASSDGQSGFCMVQGKESMVANKFPAKLRHTGDKAKLISSNDKVGFTFRGLFSEANQAASVSADVAAKSHSALRWLIARQGIRNGDQVTVTWAISGARVPQVLSDMVIDELGEDELEGLFAGGLAVSNENPIENNVAIHDNPHGKIQENDLGFKAAELLKQKMNGCLKHLPEHETLSLLALDSATPGRMALTYYQEFLPADYFQRLNQWIDDFSWYQHRHIKTDQDPKGKWRDMILPPSPYAIFETIYGKTADKDGKIKKQLYLRLLPVIAGGDKAQIPLDLVEQSIQAACKPSAYEAWEWQRNIGVACALYKGWRARHHDLSQRRTYSMSLDKNLRSRDYLYGRLLAVAENIESYALYLAGEQRNTNAERYMQRFAKQPCATWRDIELALKPYQERLQNNGRDTGKQAIDEIMELFDHTDFTNDNPLSGEFLLGYHCQRMEIKRQVAALKSQKSEKSQS